MASRHHTLQSQWYGFDLHTFDRWAATPEAQHYLVLLAIAVVAMVSGAISMRSPSLATTSPRVAQAAVGQVPVAALQVLDEPSGGVAALPGVEGAIAQVEEVGPFTRVLTGTAVTDDPRLDAAMFRRPEGSSSRLYRKGDFVDGYRIARIEPRQVTLVDPSGQRWVTRVSFYPSAVRPGAEAADPLVVDDAPASNPEPERIRRRLFKRLTVQGLVPDEQLTSVFDPSGTIRGYEVMVTRGSVADRLGLADGDVVTSIAGIAAGEMGNPNDVLAELHDEGSVCMDVERAGAPIGLCYESR